MSEAIDELKKDYKELKKEATTKEEKENKKMDKVWDKFEKDYDKIAVVPKDEDIQVDVVDDSNNFDEQNKQHEDVLKHIDELINQLDDKIKEAENNRSDYYNYKQGDITFGDSQCEFCKYNTNNNTCIKYPNGKPDNIINSEVKCEYLEIEKNN